MLDGNAGSADGEVPQAGTRISCVILEDEVLVAEVIQNDVEDIGYHCAGTFHRVSEMMEWLEHETPAIAVLDFRLPDGDCLAPAAVLRERGVPILVHSAYRPRGAVVEAIRGAPWLLKPAGPMALKAAIWKLGGLLDRPL